MITEIGIVAGGIWHFLDQHANATLSQLAGALEQPRELILMSLGWLAREGHVNLGNETTDYLARLNSKS